MKDTSPPPLACKAVVQAPDTLAADQTLQLVLNSISDQAVFTLTPGGIITTWSDGCRRMYTAEEAIGQSFRMLYTEEDTALGQPESNLKKACDAGEYHEEGLRIRKGGEPFMAEVSIYPMKNEGRLVGFVKIVRDVSERSRLTDERDDLDASLKTTTAELEGFCHVIAHDLRTPIRAIVGKCRIVQEEYAPELSSEARAYLGTLVKSALRLGQLVDDLGEFSRLGRDRLIRRSVDVSELAERLADEIGPECQHGTADIDVSAGMHAEADPTMLEFVLRNLIENSCKFSKGGVHVRIGMDVTNGESVFHVHDDGIGFDMEHVKKLFEPFQRLHGADAYGGTGIGLANVKRIVERHGGHVWAESEPGKGASFFFTL